MRSSTLKELALTNITFKAFYGDANLDLQPTTSSIERLDLRKTSFRDVWRIMGRPTPPASLPMPYPFITFAHLRHLSISGSLPNVAADMLWRFMLDVANTLETLEMDGIKWRGKRFGCLFPLKEK